MSRMLTGALATLLAFTATRASAQTVPSGYIAQTVVTGLQQPTSIVFLGPGELFVLQQAGQVQHVQITSSGFTIQTVATIPGSGIEGGLLGIALPADFSTSHDVFIYHTDDNVHLDRMTWDGMSLTLAAPVLQVPGAGSAHVGGVLTF